MRSWNYCKNIVWHAREERGMSWGKCISWVVFNVHFGMFVFNVHLSVFVFNMHLDMLRQANYALIWQCSTDNIGQIHVRGSLHLIQPLCV